MKDYLKKMKQIDPEMDRMLGSHEQAIEDLQRNQSRILTKLDWLTLMVVASLANIPITMVM